MWQNHKVKEATWKMKEDMKFKYPQLFSAPGIRAEVCDPWLTLGYDWVGVNRKLGYDSISLKDGLSGLSTSIFLWSRGSGGIVSGGAEIWLGLRPKLSSKQGRDDDYMEKRSSFFKDDYIDDDDDDDGEMVPPHLIIRRKMARRMMAFSCCGGYERTLKGRELSHIRNSILRMTGACLVVNGKELRGESGGTPVVMDKSLKVISSALRQSSRSQKKVQHDGSASHHPTVFQLSNSSDTA
ncbi:putative TBC1 domain family member 13-like [Capsicum annuum]|nr:putative TBC1 domain family member 13-like [Capsicum annuum]